VERQALRRALLRFPLMTARVIAAIHWEALKLFLKKVPGVHASLPAQGFACIYFRYRSLRRCSCEASKGCAQARLKSSRTATRIASASLARTVLRLAFEVHDERFFRRAVLGGDVAIGESWMDGDWSSPDLVAVVRLAVRNLGDIENRNRWLSAIRRGLDFVQHRKRGNTVEGSRRNILPTTTSRTISSVCSSTKA